MNISEVSKRIYENNKAKGFWDTERNIGEMLMLVTSELAEALEADRKGRTANVKGYEIALQNKADFNIAFTSSIKDTFEDEIADAVIRLFDISHGLGIDLEWHIQQKMKYNASRPHKHGKAY